MAYSCMRRARLSLGRHSAISNFIGLLIDYDGYVLVDNRVERTVIAAIEDNCILNWLRESTQELRQ